MALFALEMVSLRLGGRAVLSRVSLALEEGQRMVLLGPSGSGKTSLLRMMAGLTAPDEGRVLYRGRTASEKGRVLVPPEARSVGMVFQDLALWPHLSVRGNLAFGLQARGVPRAERVRRIGEILELVGLAGRVEARPSELSGGEQQRVALARALVTRPEAVLMDEPLSSLDPVLRRKLRREILDLQHRLSFALLYVTHDLEEAFTLGRRIVVLEEGRVVRTGSREEIEHYFEEMLSDET